MAACAGGLGEAPWEVFRTEQRYFLQEERSFLQEQGFKRSPKQVESMSAVELVKVIGGNWATSFWPCNPFPKHSHTTTLFQSSLSRNTSHGAVLRVFEHTQGVWTNQSFFLFLAQIFTRSETSLPMLSLCTFTQHSQLVWSTAISGRQSPPGCSSGLFPCLEPCEPLACGTHSSGSSVAIREFENQSDELYGLSRESASATGTLTQLELKSDFISLSVSHGVNHRLPRKQGAWDSGFPSNKL